MLNYHLKTIYGEKLDKKSPLSEYPRPLFKRDSYLSLNGVWSYAIKKKDETFDKAIGEILVPFCVESSLSGVRYDLKEDEVIWYYKNFRLPKDFNKGKVILHLDGVMQKCEVYLNEVLVGKNNEGFLPFKIDISTYLKDRNTLKIKVENKPDYNYGVGKEGYKRGGMWYTRTTGIYKSIWLESYDEKAITSLKLKTDISGRVYGVISSLDNHFELEIYYQNKLIQKEAASNNFDFAIKNPKLWDIDHPNLYTLIIKGSKDQIETYFGFRKFEIIENKFYLNNKEIFINGVLNQGYFSDGIYTPGSYEAFKDDILKMKKLGFNTLRMHIKVENEMFYYYADKLGMLILQDFPNTGKYSFLVDSILPVICFKKLKKKKVREERYHNFIDNNQKLIELLSGHPSVVYYTIFNEGWGEFKTQEMYHLFKDKYPEYVFDSASGWFNQKESDVLSIHNYFFKLKVPKTIRPVILSEYGGYNYRVSGHIFNDNKDYGYHKVQSKEQLKQDLDELFLKIEILRQDGLAGAIYTQLSDVEDETNGLLTYDRKIQKYER